MRSKNSKKSKPSAKPSVTRFARCFEEASALLRNSADQWAKGDPEDPTTLEVLLNILQAFAKDGFLFFPTEAKFGAAAPIPGIFEAKSAG